MSIEIRKALAGDAEELLDLMRILGKETDNLTFGEEGLPFTVEKESMLSFFLLCIIYLKEICKKDKRTSGNVFLWFSSMGQDSNETIHYGEITKRGPLEWRQVLYS